MEFEGCAISFFKVTPLKTININHTDRSVLSSSSADVTSWRDGGGRALAPTLSGEGAAEGGNGGALVMDGAAGVPPQNSQSHGPPRNPPAGSPALPLPQPPVGPGFPQYRGIMPPFVSLISGKYFNCYTIIHILIFVRRIATATLLF